MRGGGHGKSSLSTPVISPATLDQLRARAIAKRIELQRLGQWEGGIRPHTEYQRKPLEWIVKYLEVPEETLRWSISGPEYLTHEWDGDRDPLIKILDGLAAWKNVGCEAATGTQKTYTAACVVFWFQACFENSLVITVAPTENMLLKQLWKEIGDLWPRFQKHFPNAELLSGLIRMRPQEAGREKWAALAFVCGVGADEEIAGRAKGFHAEHMLIISEETQSIHSAIITSFDHTRTADHNLHLALGNPDNQQDELHKFCERPTTVAVRISAFDHPNIVTGCSIVPAAIGPNRLEERKHECDPPDSRMYLSQIRGICPKESEESLIRWEWCEAAAKRFDDPAYRVGGLALGADVADSPTGDKAAIARGQGACCTEVVDFRVRDANEVAQRIFLDATSRENPVDPRYIGIDSVGVGASAVNELKRLGLKVRLISGGQKAIPRIDTDLLWSETKSVEGRVRSAGPLVVEAERYDNTRSQVWWTLREDLRLNRIALPEDPELFKDLTAPTFGTPNNKIAVEGKDKLRTRLGRSPNKGDALAYWNWVRRRSPLNTRVPPSPVSKNEDRGLERLLAKHNKQREQKERRFQRMLRQRQRGRKK